MIPCSQQHPGQKWNIFRQYCFLQCNAGGGHHHPKNAAPTDFLSQSAWNTSAIIRRLPDRQGALQFLPLHHTRQSVLPAEHPTFHGRDGSALPGLPNPCSADNTRKTLLYFLMRSFLIFNFIKHSTSFRMALIPQEYGCDIFSQPHVSDINDTLFFHFSSHSFLWHRICPRLPGCLHPLWCSGNITGGCFASHRSQIS